MPAVFQSELDLAEVGREWIERLKQEAGTAPLLRARLCLHHRLDDPVQEMVIAFRQGSLVRPHRHQRKAESLHVIDGELLVVFFDDSGKVTRTIHLAAGAGADTRLYRLSAGQWHTVVPLTPHAVVHEVTTGPFEPGRQDFASWAPADPEPLRAWINELVATHAPVVRPAHTAQD
jgi:cupin fold WbuC family metalloprotein